MTLELLQVERPTWQNLGGQPGQGSWTPKLGEVGPDDFWLQLKVAKGEEMPEESCDILEDAGKFCLNLSVYF